MTPHVTTSFADSTFEEESLITRQKQMLGLLKLLVFYVSSKASKAMITTDFLGATGIKRIGFRNLPECSAR
jgi:hypothetical protein